MVSSSIQCSRVMLILWQCSNNSKSPQIENPSWVDFQPKAFFVAWIVTAGASIPSVSNSDFTIIVSSLLYLVKEGMPKKARKRPKRRSCMANLETNRGLSSILIIWKVALLFRIISTDHVYCYILQWQMVGVLEASMSCFKSVCTVQASTRWGYWFLNLYFQSLALLIHSFISPLWHGSQFHPLWMKFKIPRTQGK